MHSLEPRRGSRFIEVAFDINEKWDGNQQGRIVCIVQCVSRTLEVSVTEKEPALLTGALTSVASYQAH